MKYTISEINVYVDENYVNVEQLSKREENWYPNAQFTLQQKDSELDISSKSFLQSVLIAFPCFSTFASTFNAFLIVYLSMS